jgi:hypothetical protein
MSITGIMSFYVLTLAHFSGDHCHVIGIYDDKNTALQHMHIVDNKNEREQNVIVELVSIPKNKLNTLLYSSCLSSSESSESSESTSETESEQENEENEDETNEDED